MPFWTSIASMPATESPALIALASNDWHTNWMNRQQILSRLAQRGWQVIYSTGVPWIWQIGGAAGRHMPWLWHTVEQDGVTLVEPSRLLPRWQRWRAWDTLAVRAHAARMRALVPRDKRGELTAMVFDPEFFPFIEHLRPARVVFHVRDAYAWMPGWTDQANAQFEALQRRADLITIASTMIRETLLPEVAGKTRCLMNGADIAAAMAGPAAPCPEDLAAIPGPRIGYVGVISLKVDIDLIGSLADRHPDWHWVFIGPLAGLGSQQDAASRWERFIARHNVHWLGERKHFEVPAYVGHMDVNIMPYVTDERAGRWARFAYPLKLHEYLATGLPTISADLPELYQHRDVLEVVDGLEAWDAALCRAVAGEAPGSTEARQAVAREHSWDRRVDDLDGWLRSLSRSEAASR